MMMPDVKSELKESVEDGLSRYPDWPELTKVKKLVGILNCLRF